MFAVLDHYEGSVCLAFRGFEIDTHELTKDPKIFPAPYAAKHGWWCMRADKAIARKKLERLIDTSYRIVPLKRMLTILDDR